MSDVPELSSKTRRFLEARRDEGTPASTDIARVRAAALAAVVPPIPPVVPSVVVKPDVAPVAPAAPVVSMPVVATLSMGVKVAIGLALAAAVVGAAVVSFRPSVTPAAQQVAIAPVVEQAAPAVQPVVVVETDSPPTAGTAAQPPPVMKLPSPKPIVAVIAKQPAVAQAPVDTLERELSSLSEVRALLRASNGQKALDALDAYEKAFGQKGVLREEALAARVLAHCAVKQVDAAKAAEATLRSVNAASVHLERVRSACW